MELYDYYFEKLEENLLAIKSEKSWGRELTAIALIGSASALFFGFPIMIFNGSRADVFLKLIGYPISIVAVLAIFLSGTYLLAQTEEFIELVNKLGVLKDLIVDPLILMFILFLSIGLARFLTRD